MNGYDWTPKVTRVTETVQLNPAGQPRTVEAVEFTVGEHGPFQEVFEKTEFNSVAVRAKLQQFANQLQQLMS